MGKTITAGFISDTINGIGINSSIKCNNDNLNNNTSRSVAYVVMHYTGNSKDTAKANANYFGGAGRNASAHFFVEFQNILCYCLTHIPSGKNISFTISKHPMLLFNLAMLYLHCC